MVSIRSSNEAARAPFLRPDMNQTRKGPAGTPAGPSISYLSAGNRYSRPVDRNRYSRLPRNESRNWNMLMKSR